MIRPGISAAVRRTVRERAKGFCEYCRSQDTCGASPFNVEHIFPAKFGGTDEIANLAYACNGCNGHKSTKTEAFDPNFEQNSPIFNPREQIWEDHFSWDSTATLLIGKTSVGRATILALKMNRAPLVILRKGMVLLGIHPPKTG